LKNSKSCLVLGVIFFLLPFRLAAENEVIVSLELEGQKSTKISWVIEYLGLDFPAPYAPGSEIEFEKKLLNTGVFVFVRVKAEPVAENPHEFILNVHLVEKWTIIPVARGVFGGGTPLTVLGVYDTHTFGRLWTLGIEAQRYGEAEPGFVVWARAPRWRQGNHTLGLELWRSLRIRSIYDRNDLLMGEIRSDSKLFRLIFGKPWYAFSLPLQIRFSLDLRQENPSRFVTHREYTGDGELRHIALSDRVETEVGFLPSLIFDNVNLNQTSKDGSRLVISAGPTIVGNETSHRYEAELFHYKLLANHTSNLAAHLFAGESSRQSLHNQYFLGGFDSIRGLPDGIIYGTKALYGNFEWREFIQGWRYLLLHGVAFYDTGGASHDWEHYGASVRHSAGAGVRLTVPQVYRLMLRIDHAWSLSGDGKSGWSAGFNHFFQPYKPL